MAETWLRQCLYAFPSVALLLGVLAMVHQDGVHLLIEAPFWLAQIWYSELISLLLSQVQGMIYHPKPEIWKLMGLAPELTSS